MSNISKFRKKTAPSSQETIDVKNPKLEASLSVYFKDRTPENLNAMVEELVKSRVLLPANMAPKINQPIPCAIRNKEGQTFLPVYTQKNQIPKEPASQVIMNVPFMVVAETALTNEEGAGVVINPFAEENMIIKRPLIERMIAVEKAKKEGKPLENLTQTKEVKMTEEEYTLFECNTYAFAFLPGKFFENPSEFIETLTQRKEEYIDELFEESFKQKRMYPYLPEDFSVMSLGISEQMTAIRVDMPTDAQMAAGPFCVRIYMVYDKENHTSRYFTIERLNQTTLLSEITSDKKHIPLQDAPVEGAELQTIIDLIAE